SAAASRSQQAIQEINDAVARAAKVANKRDTLAQTLPAQLESAFREKAHQAAKAAQEAAVADVQQRLAAEFNPKISSSNQPSIAQCTAEIDAKVAEFKEHVDGLRQSLSQ